jgi:hypothetical protein
MLFRVPLVENMGIGGTIWSSRVPMEPVNFEHPSELLKERSGANLPARSCKIFGFP